MNALSQDEFERFQQLSNSFEADLPVRSNSSPMTAQVVGTGPAHIGLPQGPLVSAKQSTQAIASEYENADPVYATKTKVWPSRCKKSCSGSPPLTGYD